SRACWRRRARSSPFYAGRARRRWTACSRRSQRAIPRWSTTCTTAASRISHYSSPLSNVLGMSGRIRVVLVEDNQMFRQTLELLLELRSTIEVIGSVATGREAVEVAERLRP